MLQRAVRLFRAAVAAVIFVVVGAVSSANPADPESLDLTITSAFMSDMVQHHYFDDSAIPVSQANKVLQTRDGYIWVGSNDGLVRFGGKASRLFTPEDGLGSSSISDIFEDSRGNLWIATNNAGIFLLGEGNVFRSFSVSEGLVSDTVRCLAEDSGGNLYAATNLGVSVIDPDFTVSEVRSGRSREAVPSRKIALDRSDNIWCIRDNGGVVVLRKSGEVVREIAPLDIDGFEFSSVFQTKSGKVYLGTTENRVILFNRPESEYHRVLMTGSKRSINGFGQDAAGRIWVCADNGMGYFDNLAFHPVDGALLDTGLVNMFQDYEGGYWFASSRKGVLHARQSRFRDVALANRLPELTVNATRFYDGRLYIGADEGLFIARTTGDNLENDLTRLLAGVRVSSLAEDEAGNLWVGTHKYGVIRRAPDGTTVTISTERGLAHNRVHCVLPLEDGLVAVGTNEGVSIVKGDWAVGHIGRVKGVTNPAIHSLCVGEDGTLYAGSDGGGVYVIKDQRVSRAVTTDDGLASNIVPMLANDPVGGGMWISTGNALCLYKDGAVQRLTRLNGYASGVFDIKFAGDGKVWLLTSKGVWALSGEGVRGGEGPVHAELFTRRDGLTSTVTANSRSHLLGDGRLFIACNRGVIVTNINAEQIHTARPKVAVNRVVVDDVVNERPSSVRVPPGARRVSIDFAVLSFAYTSGNEASVFLKGFEEEAETVSTDLMSYATFTNLPGGEYEFHLVGRNKDGVESEPCVLPIYKEPRLTEEPVSRAVMVLGGFLGLFGAAGLYSRYKTRDIRKRQGEYRSITEQAITAIADTIDAKDEYTAGHSKRVAHYSREIAKRMGVRGEELENLYYTALLHDIGKIGLEDAILKKRGGLTDEEYAKMKRHTSIGAEILRSITVIRRIEEGARFHHERYDGKGYPCGLGGEEIPLTARIICVADAYDAMSTNRPYRDSLDWGFIIEELNRCAGAQFDAAIVPHMVDIAKRQMSDQASMRRWVQGTRVFRKDA